MRSERTSLPLRTPCPTCAATSAPRRPRRDVRAAPAGTGTFFSTPVDG